MSGVFFSHLRDIQFELDDIEGRTFIARYF